MIIRSETTEHLKPSASRADVRHEVFPQSTYHSSDSWGALLIGAGHLYASCTRTSKIGRRERAETLGAMLPGQKASVPVLP